MNNSDDEILNEITKTPISSVFYLHNNINEAKGMCDEKMKEDNFEQSIENQFWPSWVAVCRFTRRLHSIGSRYFYFYMHYILCFVSKKIEM